MIEKLRQLGSLPSSPFASLCFIETPASVKRVATKSQTSAIYTLIRKKPRVWTKRIGGLMPKICDLSLSLLIYF